MTKEARRGAAKKGQAQFVPLPKMLQIGIKEGTYNERKRIIDLLIQLKAIRRDALGYLVAFNTDGTEVIYLNGLEDTK